MEREQYILNTLSQMQSLTYDINNTKSIEEIKDRDIVLFLGNTRAGKSTTVNYVIGNSLKSEIVIKTNKKKRMKCKIVRATENSAGPVIGQGSTSETAIPTIWTSSKISGVVVDAPGFGDNRGEAQDVVNAFYIKELIANANSVKLVLISDINSIVDDNIGQFLSFIDMVNTMIPQCNSLQNGMVLVFTKDELDTTREEVCGYMKEKILSPSEIQVSNKELVQFFVNNPNHIVIIKMPTAEGIIEDTIFDDLIDVIESQTAKICRESLSSVTTGISDKSRGFLLEARVHLSKLHDFDKNLKAVENNFISQINDVTFDTIFDGQKILENLMEMDQKVKKILDSAKNAEDFIQDLNNLIPEAASAHEIAQIKIKIKFVKFIDQILQMGINNIFITKIDVTIANMNSSLVQCVAKTNNKIAQIQAADAERKLKEEEALKEQEEQKRLEDLRRENEEQQRQMQLLQQQKDEERRRNHRDPVRVVSKAVVKLRKKLF